MKKIHFILCCLLMLGFCFAVTAKELPVEKPKIEMVKYHNQTVEVFDFDFSFTANQATAFVFTDPGRSFNDVAIVPNQYFSSERLVVFSNLYSTKLNSNYQPDKRKQLQFTGVVQHRWLC
jgi:hypothetical protein